MTDCRTGFTYDDTGNLLNHPSPGSGQAVLSYNAADQRSGSTQRQWQSAGYSYDAANRLSQTLKDGVTTTYAYDDGGTRTRILGVGLGSRIHGIPRQ